MQIERNRTESKYRAVLLNLEQAKQLFDQALMVKQKYERIITNLV